MSEIYVSNCECKWWKQLQQLKQENEELRNLHINLVGVKECEIKEISKYKTALDEIEEICQNIPVKCLFKDRLELAKFILQKIKQAKEGER